MKQGVGEKSIVSHVEKLGAKIASKISAHKKHVKSSGIPTTKTAICK
jgi:hypothetical protein